MTDAIKNVAKAITAMVVPFAIYGIDKLAEWVGMPTPDDAIVGAVVVAVVSAVLVWRIPNTPKPVEEVP